VVSQGRRGCAGSLKFGRVCPGVSHTRAGLYHQTRIYMHIYIYIYTDIIGWPRTRPGGVGCGGRWGDVWCVVGGRGHEMADPLSRSPSSITSVASLAHLPLPRGDLRRRLLTRCVGTRDVFRAPWVCLGAASSGGAGALAGAGRPPRGGRYAGAFARGGLKRLAPQWDRGTDYASSSAFHVPAASTWRGAVTQR